MALPTSYTSPPTTNPRLRSAFSLPLNSHTATKSWAAKRYRFATQGGRSAQTPLRASRVLGLGHVGKGWRMKGSADTTATLSPRPSNELVPCPTGAPPPAPTFPLHAQLFGSVITPRVVHPSSQVVKVVMVCYAASHCVATSSDAMPSCMLM